MGGINKKKQKIIKGKTDKKMEEHNSTETLQNGFATMRGHIRALKKELCLEITLLKGELKKEITNLGQEIDITVQEQPRATGIANEHQQGPDMHS